MEANLQIPRKFSLIRANYNGPNTTMGKLKLKHNYRYDIFVSRNNSCIDVCVLSASKYAHIEYEDDHQFSTEWGKAAYDSLEGTS